METFIKFKNIIQQASQIWAIMLPIQFLGIYGFYRIMLTESFFLSFLLVLLGYILIMVIGISSFFHRYVSHKSFKCNRFIKIIGLWLGTLAGQGSVIWWAGLHRSYHHRYTDTDKDPHSPIHGFFHSYFIWMFKVLNNKINKKDIIDLLRDVDVLFFHTHYKKIIFVSYTSIYLINTEIFFWALCIPAMLTLHSFSLTTSFGHIKKFGYTNFETQNNSTNNVMLFPLIFGDAWHNNHHGQPSNPNFKVRWFELDPAYLIIKFIKS